MLSACTDGAPRETLGIWAKAAPNGRVKAATVVTISLCVRFMLYSLMSRPRCCIGLETPLMRDTLQSLHLFGPILRITTVPAIR